MKPIKVVEIFLTLLLIVLAIYAGNISFGIRHKEPYTMGHNVPMYHFALITDEDEGYFHQSFTSGLNSSSQEKKVVVETYQVNLESDHNTLKQHFETIWLSNVDGIIVKLSNNELARHYIQMSHEKDISIVTVGNDSPDSQRDAYIGTNKYDMGRVTAELCDESTNSVCKIAVILGNEFAEKSGSSNNNYINGILEYSENNKSLIVESILYSSDKRAEFLVAELLNKKNIDCIITTDPLDALRVTRVLIDLNQVGNVKIIASSDLPEIISYLDKGTIFASIVMDFETLGSKSVEILYYLLNEQRQSSYINIPIKILTKNNIEEYLKNQ
ncbi:MAG: substrate-binding domain-containing protein [Clostridia bacterium]|nr:substrate-binding domain-containing protein [Clostridia bacterium]